jgi:cob(I)alamin adenosyltransferase
MEAQMNHKEYRMMATGAVELVLGEAEQEETRVRAMVTQAIQTRASLFVGRFLTDLSVPDEVRSFWAKSRVVLRQYGCSCHVNAPPPLADAGRAEIGLEEAEAALRSGKYDLVLLSQILTAVEEDLLTTADLLALIAKRPTRVTLILTGLHAPTDIIAECGRSAAVSRAYSLDISRRN